MTHVVVTGAAGQIGGELVRAEARPGLAITGLTRAELDIADTEASARVMDHLAPDVIVNTAAYTAVDQAEHEPDLALAVNADGVANLAAAADRLGARLIHLSTDYVFDGTKDGWYVETDPIAPLGVYGVTKAAGEEAARGIARHLILRTAWVYSAIGHNFIATMRRLGAERDQLGVIDDQFGCPAAAPDIAAAILDLIEAPDDLTGTFHLASPTDTSWFGFACAALQDRIAAGLEVRPITTADYPTAAERPANSRLDSTAIQERAGIRLPRWQDSLPGVVAELEH